MYNKTVTDLQQALKECVQRGGSDVLIIPNDAPTIRVNGAIQRLSTSPWSSQDCEGMIFSILNDYQKERFKAEGSLDFSFSIHGLSRFRINVFRQSHGVAANIRIISERIPCPGELGLTPAIVKLTDLPRGLVLVTGPTGSGKSTTLASLIEVINAGHSKHILTIEDPIEYAYQSKKSVVNQREVGSHAKSFSQALRDALRQNPDVILIGEMRDLETISLAVTAAETGHLCFATLHTQDAPASIDRIINAFQAESQAEIRTQLSIVLAGVVSQTLLPRVGGGRVCAREVMLMTSGISNLIRDGKTHMIYSEIETGSNLGMISLDQHLASLVKEGIVDLHTALSKAHNAANLRNILAMRSAQVPAQPAGMQGQIAEILNKKLW